MVLDFWFCFCHFLYLLSTSSSFSLTNPPPLPPSALLTCSPSLASLLLFFLRLPAPPQTPPTPPPGRLGLAASYLSVKALVPQMPKLLKSLFPARDDKKELRPSPHNQQVSRGRCRGTPRRASRQCFCIKLSLTIQDLFKGSAVLRVSRVRGQSQIIL